MVKLSTKDIEYLLSLLSTNQGLAKNLREAAQNESLEISDELADELRDICCDRLDTHGFDENYDPTTEGVTLENLIDKLFVG